MTDRFHHGTVHLTECDLRVDRSSGILEGVELLDLDLTCSGVDGHLSEVRTVRNGGRRRDECAVCDHLSVSAAAACRVGKDGIRKDLAGLLRTDLTGSPELEVLLVLLHLVCGFLEDHVLELPGCDNGGISAEERSGRCIGTGIEGT